VSDREAVTSVELPGLPRFRRGKVRETFDLGDRLLMVATDRISAYDVVLPTPIPGKGVVLTELSRFWFGLTSGLVPNHLITTDLDAVADGLPTSVMAEGERLRGRTMVVRKAERIDVECVMRGYLAGSAWAEYRRDGRVAGEALPAELRRGDRLPAPLFGPALKVDEGHDVNVSPADVADAVGEELAGRLEEASRDLYQAASDHARARGIILADTKFEFGLVDGKLTLIDELLTPDSSRFWDATTYAPGEEQPSFDKQYVRDWLGTTGWDRQPPGPELPPDVVQGTVERYHEALRRLTADVDTSVSMAVDGNEEVLGG
jgi:phosphoribosylaminoimidazole-succinocarboxamide synthase